MHAAKRPNSTKIKSAKTFLKAFPRTFIPSKYTRYTVIAVFFLITHADEISGDKDADLIQLLKTLKNTAEDTHLQNIEGLGINAYLLLYAPVTYIHCML